MQFEPGTQSISWFLKEYREGSIALRPPYQRKPVWAARQKCYLVESILLGYPVPEIFVDETTTAAGVTIHAIVDGQQRIRTVLQFLGMTTVGPDGKPEVEESEFTGFALDKFERRATPSVWLGKRFVDLSEDDKVSFFQYKFHIRYLHDADEGELREMFTRLNRYLTPLNAQELRHATYTGPFAKLAEELAEDEYWLNTGLVTRALIRRIGDVEFVSQLLIGVMHGPQGGSPAIVDEYYRQYEDYELEEGLPDQRRTVRLFSRVRGLIDRLYPKLGQDPDLRWGNRADYYSLFVAVAQVVGGRPLIKATRIKTLRSALTAFSSEVNRRVADEKAKVSAEARTYAAAVEKGVNDRARRAERHAVLVKLIESALADSGKRASRG